MATLRARRFLRRAFGSLVVVMVVLLGAATFYYANLLHDGLLVVEQFVGEPDVRVLSVGNGVVTLERTENSAHPGIWGLDAGDDYATVGEIVMADSERVTRELVAGEGVLRSGELVYIDGFAFDGDPAALGIEFDDVTYSGPLGNYPAWRIEGTDDTWVVFVHGKGSSRAEALRLLPAVSGAGYPTLIITYRNDTVAPADPSQRYGVGATEWTDLEAAVQYAVDEGAADVVIVGYSMGATITSLFLHESELAEVVGGLILDAPLLDVGAAVDVEAEGQNVPGFLTGWAKALATVRWGIEWSDLNQLVRADEFDVPILIFHGDQDESTPIWVSDAFAAARPDLVTYERVPGAGHVESWNFDRERYEAAVLDFLDQHAFGESPAPIMNEPES